VDAIAIIQFPAGASYLLAVGVVGCRLLMLARRTRQVPERLLGLSLLLGGTLGGPLEAAALAGKGEFDPAVAGGLLVAGKLFALAALALQCTFVWRVFRPSEPWAPWLVALILVFPIAAFGQLLAGGMASSGEIPFSWFWVEQIGRVGASCWLVVEGVRYHGMMRRRLALGLADPLVTNRFLLWTLAGAASIVFMLTAVPPMFLAPHQHELLLLVDLVVFSVAGMAVSVLYLLAFLPPRAYRRLLAGAERVELT
jgi:hypothetical protein